MLNSLPLRTYQLEAIEAVENSWSKGVLRPAVVLPTGAGKTVTFSHLIKRWVDRAPVDRVVVLVHRDELAKQAKEKISAVIPDLEVGIVKAEQNDIEAPVIVASVQTLFNKNRREQLYRVGMVVVDECHHHAAPAYREVLEELGLFDGSVLGVGFTATMHRSDSYGLGDVWEEVVYERDILWGIANGFLVDVRAESVTVDDLNLAEIARNHGDYQEGKLGDALIASGASDVVARAYAEKAGGRQGIVFCPTVACAYEFAHSFNDHGVPAAIIIGETSIEDRQRIYEAYRQGHWKVLVSVMALTEGFDMPQAEVAVIARPSQSPSLRIQMIGRVLRPHPGKDSALVLDVVGAVSGGALTGLSDLSRTEVAPVEGESLAEALERSEDEAANITRDVIAGKATYATVNLFKGSDAVWLRTHGGVWFVPLSKFYLFLWGDSEGRFRVGRTHSQWKMKGPDAGWLTDRPMSLELALAWGEQLAIEADPLVADRSRDWRKNRRKPTPKQFEVADRLRLSYDPKIRKNELSDMISVHYASRLLDRR